MGRIFMLGAGAMTESFIKGVCQHPEIAPSDIHVMNRNNRARLQLLHELYGVSPAESMRVAGESEVIILSVKPYDVRDALSAVAPYLHGQTVISFAAGISISFMERLTHGNARIIRTMPNLPVAVLEGAIALAASERVEPDALSHARLLLAQLGTVVELPESMMDAATAFSGSGPGFVSYFLEAMEEAAVEMGFPAPLARSLLIQTMVGTAQILEDWRLSPSELRTRVTSPHGTTHAGLMELEKAGVKNAIVTALFAAERRSCEMGQEYADETGK